MKKINLLWSLLLFMLIFLVSACTTQVEPEDDSNLIIDEELSSVNFETLIKSDQTAYEEEAFLTITSQEEWDNLNINFTDETEVNFENEMVLAVFMGMKNSGGYSINIVEIVEKDELIEVMVEENVPGEDDMVTMAITYPGHIVKIEKTDKPIVFIK
jgi:hypothetical protein